MKQVFEIEEPSEVQLRPHQKRRIQDGIMSMSEVTIEAIDHVKGVRYDLVEVCAPWDSPLGTFCEKFGGKVARLGIHNGYDMSTRRGLNRALDFLRKHRPRVAHLSPPCFPWSPFQNLNQNTEEQKQELDQKRRLGRKIFKNLETFVDVQIDELQGDVTGEQPWNASSWQERSWQRLARKCGGRFRVDGCAFGMKNPDNGLLFQKK